MKQIIGAGKGGLHFLLKNSEDGSSFVEAAKMISELYIRFRAEADLLILQMTNSTRNVSSSSSSPPYYYHRKNALERVISDKSIGVENIVDFMQFTSLPLLFVDESTTTNNDQTKTSERRTTTNLNEKSFTMTKATVDHIMHRAKRLSAGLDESSKNVVAEGETTAAARSILQSSTADGRDDISRYSTMTSIRGNAEEALLSDRIADRWLEGPFSWPPNIDYWDGKSPCAIYETTKENLMVSTQVLTKYYTTDAASRNRAAKASPWNLISNLPRFYNGTPAVDETKVFTESTPALMKSPSSSSSSDFVAVYYNFFIKYVLGTLTGITPARIQAFFTSGRGLNPDRDGITIGHIAR